GNLADAPTLSEVGDYENVEVPIWRGVAAPKNMSDEAYAFWDGVLGKVAETDQWKTDYLEKNKLIGEYRNAADATAYVTEYEADYMAANGIK
ncbi:MAG: tripartite tricarboxylate transporter substrate binding protein, partial [Lachnospiraceae bacterium]|nr:tripartite tricarboxylate transporter substrate binding protein [Lachnospiraceae bacterium]